MTSISSDLQKLAPGSLVELFVLDNLSITENTGQSEVFRFHAGTNLLRGSVVWQGYTYEPFPINASGFETTGRGVLPRPRMIVANVTGLISALCREMQDLIGAKVIRKRTFAKYLDAVNFSGGVNPSADPGVYFPDDIWFVHRKVSESKVSIEFELAAAFDVQGVLLPRRQVIQNICPWLYRGAECGYAGGAVADANDTPTSDLTRDRCGKRLASCRLRFPSPAELPYGGFPGAGLVR